MNTFRSFVSQGLAAAILVAIALPATADRIEMRGGEGMHGGYRGGGDIRRFDGHDYAVWRSGYWRHGRHGDRLGWWWVAGGVWYLYPEPVYPYPDPYIPPVVVTQPVPQPEPPVAQFWYYCAASNSYYPYVSSCPGGWKTVPSNPPAASPGEPPGAPAQR